MECFKHSKDYAKELEDYGASLYIIFLDNMIELLVKKGIEAIILVILNIKKSFAPLEAPSKATHLEVPEPSIRVERTSAREIQEAGSHIPHKKGVLNDDPS